MKFFYLALALLSIALPVTATELKPFTTDGCSLFPDGDRENNSKWIVCCIRHDYAYWKGGTLLEREAADAALKQCVADLGEPRLSRLMHFGVKYGGSPIFPAWYRWGYGWPYLRGYKPLVDEEKLQVKTQLNSLRELVDEFIEDANRD